LPKRDAAVVRWSAAAATWLAAKLNALAKPDTSSIRRRFDELTYEDYPPPSRLFAIVSWGAAATNWLAARLNDCPGIFCVHSSNEFWAQFADARMLDGINYMRLIGMLGSGAQAAGDVHGITRHDVPLIREAFGEERFRSAVLVRDPMARLRSQLGLFKRYAEVSTWDVSYLKDKFADVARTLPSGSYEDWLFVHGVNMLNNIVQEEEMAGPLFRMEDLTTKPEALISLVDHLTGGEVEAPKEWAETAIVSSATNRHASQESLTFTDWQKRVFEAVVEPRAIELHRELGYEFDLP
jgi:hypothetical protein